MNKQQQKDKKKKGKVISIDRFTKRERKTNPFEKETSEPAPAPLLLPAPADPDLTELVKKIVADVEELGRKVNEKREARNRPIFISPQELPQSGHIINFGPTSSGMRFPPEDLDVLSTETEILLKALRAEELFLKREKYMLEVDEMLLSRSDDQERNKRLELWINRYRESADKIEDRLNRIKAELKWRGVEGVE
ncbi:MAG: hypothetical protein QUS12_09775 [Methanosarcina sp.]|nr:hypothetical protein [Methanosarcina sp.]